MYLLYAGSVVLHSRSAYKYGRSSAQPLFLRCGMEALDIVGFCHVSIVLI